MKKVGYLLTCLMLVFSLAVSVHASDILPEEDSDLSQTETSATTIPPESQETIPETQPPHVHDWDSWITAGEKHIRTCKGCTTSEEGAHKFSSTVVKAPTCKEVGVLRYVCSDCNSTLEESIEKLKIHTYDSACDSECNVCGIKRDVEHEFEAVWVKDATGHWYACAKCDEKVAFSKHSPGPEATEEKEQVCTVCKYVINPKKKHTHSFEKKWRTDETGHWHVCKSCDAEDSYAAHVYDDVCDIDCNICDYKKEQGGHTYTDDWKTSKWEHWQICDVCHEESKHEKHIPGSEATEKEPQLCTVCSYELAPVKVHSHDFSQNWEWDMVNHWQICSCGEASVAMEHIWDQGREVQKDILEFNCIQCDATKMERKESGFPWIVLLVILALVCLVGIVVLVIMLKRGNFEEETEPDDFEDAMPEESEESFATEIPLDLSKPEEADEEIDMIDAFFASLDQE